ncbi:hypothetical protein K490DRAFT_57144 [Saccharata proteae CBS 121410]|uniref:BZIP domain-containing protein n=1 Tax=Saccharata proteae CBS 121410 TaxID=1314787 RepID=A0A9P4HV74_9PEZI|nr:hypothetical protein K490DRAFT_57144 [Saccharata proteae CBS 121410]
MSTAVQPAMGFQPFSSSQCFDPDMDSLVDFSAVPSPGPQASSSHAPASTVASSTMTSPTNTLIDPSEDHQTPAKPSHEYERFKQQTGLPPGSVPGIGMSSMNQPIFGAQPMFSNSGLEWNEFGMGSDMGMELDVGSGLPAFFYPQGAASHSDDFVDPSAITQEEPQQTVRFYPGMHQQQAAMAAKAQAQAQAQQQRQQQMLQQQQQQPQRQREPSRDHRKPSSHQFTDARTEETIARVVNQIRHNSTLSSNNDINGQGVLPHIVKMKKDEEDMDEDERLLASEEGKKLSSKERRQLRNKVSARAFRSRRKEYIGQLEGEVAAKNNECIELRMQNRSLMEENARSRAFIERLLRHQAFGPFLDELSRDPALAEPSKQQQAAPVPRQEQPNFNSAPHMFKESSQDSNSSHMTMIPEQPVDLSMLNINNNAQQNQWNGYQSNSGFNFSNPQVFAVLEVPAGPAKPFDTDLLCGKGGYGYPAELQFSEPVEELKHDYPVIERPAPATEVAESEAIEDDDDAENPDFALYVNTPAPASATANTAPSFTSEKPSQISLVVSETASTQQLERMIARMEPVYERMEALTACLDL